ncbi:hypothetical protein GCM10023310_69710 [Paenibacillus vulneris]
MRYELPKCTWCSKVLLFIDTRKMNENLKFNIYKLDSTGRPKEVVRDIDLPIFNRPESYNECPKCGDQWKAIIDEKGRIG